MDNRNPAIATLVYESIFNFPLTREEIWQYLISNKKIKRSEFDLFLKDKKIYFDKKTNLYYLENSRKIFAGKKLRNNSSDRKILLGKNIAKSLMKIPSVLLIGISGSLAMKASQSEDDIDFFIICRKNTVWITRFFCVLYLKIKGLYRSDKLHKDKICLNMIIDRLNFPEDRKDLYNAFEIAQFVPVFDRGNTYKRFLNSNSWIKKYLPNFIEKKCDKTVENTVISKIYNILFFIKFEEIAKFIQKKLMKRVTNETVTDHLLAFHPKDFRSSILTKFEAKMKEY